MTALKGRAVLLALLAAAVLLPLRGAGVARADDATSGCRHNPVDETIILPIGSNSCTGARPGGLVRTPIGSCTLSFVFQGSDGHRYIATAGHCILKDYVKDKTWTEGLRPPAIIDDRQAGEFFYATLTSVEDFALIRLDPSFPWTASMIHFGGPTGMFTDRELKPVVVHHTGNGLVIGNVFNKTNYGIGDDDVRPLHSRTGVAHDSRGVTKMNFHSPAIYGDSGSAVMANDGRAIGTLVELGGVSGFAVATRLDTSIAQAQEVLGITFTLQTAVLRYARI